MTLQHEKIPWIEGTPLGINVRSIEFVAPHFHENVLEIIFCIKGSIKIAYGYEEFVLNEGEYISIDHDAHYLSEGNENIVASFYFDLNYFKEKYKYLEGIYFVCEGLIDRETKTFQKPYYEQIRSTLVALLFYMGASKEEKPLDLFVNGASIIMGIMIKHFDVMHFYFPEINLKDEPLERYHLMQSYMHDHYAEKINAESLAKGLHVTKAYLSEFFSKTGIGFTRGLNFIRVSKSELLLLDSKMNIAEISEHCGFSDVKYYYKHFKFWYGCTPKQFREKYKEKYSKVSVYKKLDMCETILSLEKYTVNYFINTFLT